MPAAQIQQDSAGDYDAEPKTQDRQTLPCAGSGEMQQKWSLHQDRAANRDADDAPDQPPSERRRRLRRKKRAQPEPYHRISQKKRQTNKHVPPIALVSWHSERHSVPWRRIECKGDERNRACYQPNKERGSITRNVTQCPPRYLFQPGRLVDISSYRASVHEKPHSIYVKQFAKVP